jgi:hypothetical protein
MPQTAEPMRRPRAFDGGRLIWPSLRAAASALGPRTSSSRAQRAGPKVGAPPTSCRAPQVTLAGRETLAAAAGFTLANLLRHPHIYGCQPRHSGAGLHTQDSPTSQAMKVTDHTRVPAHLGYLLDELRRAGVTTYASLAAALNRQGLRPARGRWKAHELYLLMRRHRHAHPAARLNAGRALYSRRAAEARRLIGRLKRRGLKKASLIAGALNARGSTTPRHGRLWTARSVSRVWQGSRRRRRLPRR